MQLDEMPDNGEAQPKTSVGTGIASVGLHKRLKGARQEFRFYSDSVIFYVHVHTLIC
jgi:hypothetical protein